MFTRALKLAGISRAEENKAMFLKDKIAVVTGGTKGIGRAIAESFLREGAEVFVCARSAGQLKQALSEMREIGSVAGETCDIRSESQVRQMLEECERQFGGIDILVNNAGVGFFGKTVEETAPEDFVQTLETNLFGVFYACHYAVPLMKKRGGGYIFNISSLAGQNAHPRMAAYNASKFGLNGFTEALMQEVRQDDIKVSLIAPGSVNTTFGNGTVSEENAWQIQPADIAEVIIDLLRINPRTLPSKVEIRPSKPPTR